MIYKTRRAVRLVAYILLGGFADMNIKLAPDGKFRVRKLSFNKHSYTERIVGDYDNWILASAVADLGNLLALMCGRSVMDEPVSYWVHDSQGITRRGISDVRRKHVGFQGQARIFFSSLLKLFQVRLPFFYH